MISNGHTYSMNELLQLEQQMEEIKSTNIDTTDLFSFLEGHSQFSHIDKDGPNNTISYYFHNPNDGAQLLFIDIPKEKGDVCTDDGSCLGREKWFDELFEFTKKFYENQK